MRLKFLVEDALLTYQLRFGENPEYELVLRKFGTRKRVVLRIQGESFDPFGDKREQA